MAQPAKRAAHPLSATRIAGSRYCFRSPRLRRAPLPRGLYLRRDSWGSRKSGDGMAYAGDTSSRLMLAPSARALLPRAFYLRKGFVGFSKVRGRNGVRRGCVFAFDACAFGAPLYQASSADDAYSWASWEAGHVWRMRVHGLVSDPRAFGASCRALLAESRRRFRETRVWTEGALGERSPDECQHGEVRSTLPHLLRCSLFLP